MSSDITKTISKLFEAFIARPNKARLNLYAERLAPLDPHYVERACERIIDTRKSLPAIADVRELVQYLKAQDAPPVEIEPQISEEELDQRRAEALDVSQGLHRCELILDEFAADLERIGIVGEERAAKIIYLALFTRLFKRPVNVAVKGPSSGGKSETAKKVHMFHPEEASLDMAGMSARYLAYSEESFRHRFLYIWEASGLGEDAEAMLRVLLSEGSVIWRTVIDQVGVTLYKPGPTGLLITTTEVALHPENETRLLSVNVDDTPEQTRRVMESIARQAEPEEIDFVRWHGLADWIALGNKKVYVPYALRLAKLIPPLAVRLRRDFSALLGLIAAHALLHRASREEDDTGRIIATVTDYAVIRDLVIDAMSQAVESAVDPKIRETVKAVAAIVVRKLADADGASPYERPDKGPIWATQIEIARELELEQSTAHRRVKKAIEQGYLENIARSGRPKIVTAGTMQDDRTLLPTVEAVRVNGGISVEAKTGDEPDDLFDEDGAYEEAVL
jgi:hypothetical protein